MTRRGSTRNEISGGIFFSAVIQGRDITVQLPPEITPALSGLPAGTPAFTGRDADLRTLLGCLAPSPVNGDGDIEAPRASPTSTVVVAAVSGLAGIGKTELAIQAARAALDRGWFPGGVLFVDLFGYDPARSLDPGQALEGFLRALAIPAEHIPPLTQDRARLYASVLTAYAQASRRILVVIDNAATHDQVTPLLPTELTSTAIVTSRDTLGLLGARLLDLDALVPPDAAEMLDRALRLARPGDTRVSDHPKEATRLVQLCGGLPLALRIIAALLSENPHRPLAGMITDLDDERTRLDELSYADIAVRAAFELSYHRLDPVCAQLFRLLSINPGPEISTQATAVLANTDQRSARRGFEVLARAHLIDHGSNYGQWRMHDLLRLYAQQLSDNHADTDGQEQARDRLLRYYLETSSAADAHLRALPGRPGPADFASRDSAIAWLDTERPNLVAAVTMAANTGRDQIAMRLPVLLAEYFDWRRRFDDKLATITVGREAAHRLGDRGGEAVTLTILGNALDSMRRFEEAITAHQDAVAICLETGDRHGEGAALNNLGNALQQMRRFDEAIRTYQDAVAIDRETGNRHAESMALNNLGNALESMRRFDEAITTYQDAVAIKRETGDRHGEGRALDNLGNTLQKVRRFDEAITVHQDAAAIFRETGDRHGEGRALTNLGLDLQGVRRFDEAITVLQDAVAINLETNDQHGEGAALNNLGNALESMRRFEEAITAHQDAAAIFRETGDRHREGMALGGLGLDLQQMRRFDEAITAHQDAAAIFRETGDRHAAGMALNNLGLDLREVGRFDEAITAHQYAVAIFRETRDRHSEGAVLNNLSVALREVGRFDEAITVHQRAVAICLETGDRHGEGMALNNLGNTLRKARRFDEAITVHQDAAAIFRETGDRHREGMALGNLELDGTRQDT